jgi:uncharacterized protein
MDIKLTSIESSKREKHALDSGYLYKDIRLDLAQGYSYNQQLRTNQGINDVQAIYDIESIKSSIANAFLTTPGQKILNPEFGVDIRRYIFEPADDYVAQQIEEDIKDRLPTWEPRIELTKVDVLVNEDQQQFDIYMQVNVPSLNITGITLQGVLNSNGYQNV